MGLQQITLNGYHIVVAVTEREINIQLNGWLKKQQSLDIALYYTIAEDGSYVVTTQDAAKIIFTGTLSPTIDPATQQWIDMVTLHTSVGPQTIQYNVTVQDGKFQDTASGEILYQSEGADPWVIQFYVNLALQ